MRRRSPISLAALGLSLAALAGCMPREAPPAAAAPADPPAAEAPAGPARVVSAPLGPLDALGPERARLVRQIFREDIAEARRISPRAPELVATAFDLDGDGTEEVLLRFLHPAYCGSAGCSAYLLTREPYGYSRRSLPTVRDVAVLSTRTRGVHDLLMNGEAVWRWSGLEGYAFEGRLGG